MPRVVDRDALGIDVCVDISLAVSSKEGTVEFRGIGVCGLEMYSVQKFRPCPPWEQSHRRIQPPHQYKIPPTPDRSMSAPRVFGGGNLSCEMGFPFQTLDIGNYTPRQGNRDSILSSPNRNRVRARFRSIQFRSAIRRSLQSTPFLGGGKPSSPPSSCILRDHRSNEMWA
jgi:hypothetical protein